MITFQSRQKSLQYANIIERKAHNIYPHISSSKLKKKYRDTYSNDKIHQTIGENLIEKIQTKLIELRNIIKDSESNTADFLFGMQEKKVGNCFEEALLAAIIGKLNGQKNIYVGNIFVRKENIKQKQNIDHTVAFITNKKIEGDKEYSFKNKDAVIIDPWLGITDYADNYFTQIKNHFKNCFKELPDYDFIEHVIGSKSKNIQEFRKGRKKSCQNLKFNIELACKIVSEKTKLKLYKSFFPELVIKKYKRIELPKETKSKKIAKKYSL